MIIDAIFKTSVTFGIGTRLSLQHDRATVRKNQPIPDKQHATLPKPTPLSYCPITCCPLRDQKDTARRAVVDILGDLSGDLAGKI